MGARLLQTIRKWQRLGSITQRVKYQPNSAICSYATGVPRQSLHQTLVVRTSSAFIKWNTTQESVQRHYVTETKSASATKGPVLTVLLEKLQTMYQANSQVNYELCDNVIRQLESKPDEYNQLLSSEQAHFLLYACGNQMPSRPSSTRLELFQRLWNYLARHSQLRARDYVTWLHVLQHNRTPLTDFRTFLQEFKKLNANNAFQLSDIYAELLDIACATGDMKQTTELLAEMREHEFSLTERHFNALLQGHARNHDLAGCRGVLDNMAAAGVRSSMETQSALVCAYLENEEPTKASEILHKFHSQFNGVQVMRMLRSLLYVQTQQNEELIKQLIRELPQDFSEGTEVVLPLRHLCIELLHNGNLNAVNHIMDSLPTPRFNEKQNIDTFGVFLLQELFRTKCDAAEIIEVAKKLQDSAKNMRALHIATEIALRRNAQRALPFLQALAEQDVLRPHYFWPLLLHSHRLSGEAGVLNTLKIMQSFKVTCDRETITLYVLPHLPLTLQSPEQAIKALDDVGIKPSTTLIEVITHLILRQRLDAAHDLLELYPTKMSVEQLVPTLSNAAVNVRATKRYQQFVKLLAALSHKNANRKVDWVGQLLLSMVQTQVRLRGDLSAVRRYVDEMVKFGLIISLSAANATIAALEEQANKDVDLSGIKEALQKIIDHNVVLQQNTVIGGASSSVKHPRDMTLDELELHLIELEAKGMNIRGVLRRLLQICVREGRLERALEVKVKCDALRVQASAGMLASTLELYIKLKDLSNAEACLKRLQQEFPDFNVDEHKFLDYASLLVHNNQLDAAKELLQARAKTQRIHGGDYIIKNVWNFLTHVAQLAARMPTLEPERNFTRENFHFLQKLRYCNAHNSVLGPIVRERLLRGDIKAAVADFKKLAEQYKHTPLQFELLSLLVRLSNGHEPEVTQLGGVSGEEAQQLLSEVTSTIAKVHGALNMNSGLLLAFAEAGTENQLRRLLINPEFRINEELLLKNCDYLGEEGAVDTLLRLARGARGFGRIINEQNIHNMLLTHFAKANNHEAALNLYEKLEADDELKISQEFVRNLVQLLRVNNVEIPSRVALRAQII